MKQLPHIAAALYSTPWAILPASHVELSQLYRSYISGTLGEAAAGPVPKLAAGVVRASSGIAYQVNGGAGIGIIHLSGVVAKRAPEMMCGPALVDLTVLDLILDMLGADEEIQTIVMDWNSPGGTMIGMDETSGRIRDLSAQGKRMVAYTDYQMCSAAYYLAAACDEIYAAPSSLVGSIGVYVAGLDDSRAWEMEGLELVLAKSGPLKAMGHPGKAWTQEERDHLQAMADRSGAEFRGWVNERRGGVEDSAMQGQWFFAKEAPARLIDAQYRDLVALLADLAAV